MSTDLHFSLYKTTKFFCKTHIKSNIQIFYIYCIYTLSTHITLRWYHFKSALKSTSKHFHALKYNTVKLTDVGLGINSTNQRVN